MAIAPQNYFGFNAALEQWTNCFAGFSSPQEGSIALGAGATSSFPDILNYDQSSRHEFYDLGLPNTNVQDYRIADQTMVPSSAIDA